MKTTLLLVITSIFAIGSSLAATQGNEATPQPAPLQITVTPITTNSWITNKVSLQKNQELEIDVSNPGNSWHSLGFQDKQPEDGSPGNSIYHDSPFLENAVGYDIWYGSNTFLGDLDYCMHWNSSFLAKFTSDCIVDATGSGTDETPDPLVYHIKATTVSGTAYIYFFNYTKNIPPSFKLWYTQNYFNPCIEVTVE